MLPHSTYWLTVNQNWAVSPTPVPPHDHCSRQSPPFAKGGLTQYIYHAAALDRTMDLLKHRSKNYMKGNSQFLYMSCYHKSFILDKKVCSTEPGHFLFLFLFLPLLKMVCRTFFLCLMLLICCSCIWDGRAHRFFSMFCTGQRWILPILAFISFICFCVLCGVVNLSFALYSRWSWASAFRMRIGDWW